MNLYGLEGLSGAAFMDAKAFRAELLEDAACHQQRTHRLTPREWAEMRKGFAECRERTRAHRFRAFRSMLRREHYARIKRDDLRRAVRSMRDARAQRRATVG